jgi:iron-sulfur cluster assembly protein
MAGQRTERRAICRRLETRTTRLEPATSCVATASLACFRPEASKKDVSAPLALTDSAVQAVRDIVSSWGQIPETAGLRLVAERAGTQANVQVSVVPLPAEDDEVIEEQGARVFLEPEAAALLDDKVLDASVEQNQVAFTIADSVEE